MNLTPWDVQSKQIYTTDGIAPPLWAGECRYGGGEVLILQVIDAAYGVVAKGNGEAWISPNTHCSLSCGGGCAGQGYPCVLVVGHEDNNTDGEEVL